MNVRHDIYLLLLLLSFGMVACSTDASADMEEERMPVAFSTSFSAVTRSSTIDNMWISGDAVAVSNGTDTYLYTAAANSTAGGRVNLTYGTYELQFFWPTSDPNWSFTAWYPYNNGTQWTSATVAADQSVYDDTHDPATGITDDAYHAYDLLYAPSVTPGYHKRTHLVFYHQLAHVVVNATVTPKTGSTATEEITDIFLGSDNVALTGGLTMGTAGASVETPTIAWTIAPADQENTITMRHAATANTLYTYECMMLPQTVGDADTPLLTIKTSDGSLERTYLYKSSYTFLPGYEYTFTLTITEVGMLKVQNLTIVGWGTGTGGTGTVK